MKITVIFRNQKTARAVAEFCKRVTFDDAKRRAAGETEEGLKTNAYEMLDGLADIKEALENAGIYTR